MKKLFFTFLLVSVASAMFAQTNARVRSEDTNNPEIDNLSGLKPDETDLIETGTVSSLSEEGTGSISTVNANTTAIIKDAESQQIEAGKDFSLDATQVYPNPATNYITIATAEINTGTIRIMNLLGQEMSSHTITGTLTSVDISALVEGIYFVSVESGTQKIVKKIKVLY